MVIHDHFSYFNQHGQERTTKYPFAHSVNKHLNIICIVPSFVKYHFRFVSLQYDKCKRVVVFFLLILQFGDRYAIESHPILTSCKFIVCKKLNKQLKIARSAKISIIMRL